MVQLFFLDKSSRDRNNVNNVVNFAIKNVQKAGHLTEKPEGIRKERCPAKSGTVYT